MQTAGIYIHFPFCLTKCEYCDFYSLSGQEELIPRFVTALEKEIRGWPGDKAAWIFDTIFFGGGTPSLLTPEQLQSILISLKEKFELTGINEISLEANPGTITEEKLAAFREIGINRLSIGVQSFDDTNLEFLTRIHTAEEARSALKAARSAGFENLSCDLIYGLPGQTWDQWQTDLDAALSYGVEHLSCYTLTVEDGTGLAARVMAGEVTLPADSGVADFIGWTADHLSKNGLTRYEISNFARPGRECRHNLHYWRIEPYLGFGPSAHGFDGGRRWWNHADLPDYLRALDRGLSPVRESQSSTSTHRTNEMIGFGLRLAGGVDLRSIPEDRLPALENHLTKALVKWNGKLVRKGDRLSLSAAGFLFADEIAVDLML